MYSKLISTIPSKTDKELIALKNNAEKKGVDSIIESVTSELSKRHPILANNCRGFDHENEYGDGAVMDCVPDQLGSIPLHEIRDVVKFKYNGDMVQIDTYTNCHPKEITIADSGVKEFSKHNGKSGYCFFGDSVSSEVVTKENAAKLYPAAFNKKGHFCQFTFKRA